jgi:UPF0716 protein FxsA
VPLLLLVLFVVVPAIEIYVLIQVGQAIGALPTVALLAADAVLGTWLLKREGRKAWTAFRQALEARRVPGKEVADGALVVLGGAFLITPGFVTDVLGVLCLLPPTRALLRRLLTGVVTARLIGSADLPGSAHVRRPGASRSGGTDHPVIDGDVVDEDP